MIETTEGVQAVVIDQKQVHIESLHETSSSTASWSSSSDGEEDRLHLSPDRPPRRDLIEEEGDIVEHNGDSMVNLEDRKMEVEETESAAAILSSVCVPSETKKQKMMAHNSAGPVKVGEGYEDLLDCLASLASSRAPLMPLHCRVSRMAVDDINVGTSSNINKSGGSRSSLSSPSDSNLTTSASASPVEEEEEEVFTLGRGCRTRPRAISNPEGCDVWRKYENDHHRGSSSSTNVDGKRPSLPYIPRKPGMDGGVTKSDASCSMLPHMLAKYADIYNKHGRIGIYTREERDAIIARFLQKRTRRVWAKKIRYSCRKNLADKRIRVKGRFVKLAPQEDGGMEEDDDDSQMVGFREDGGNVGGPRPVDVLSSIQEGKSSAMEQTAQEDVEAAETLPVRRMRRHSFA